MIIGISGKIGSGKDTVGKIIQYLELQNTYPNVWKGNSFEKFLDYPNSHTWESNFVIKKFADKLKDIVCILIGCTREQLEDRDFKEKELGEEWWYWKVYSSIRNDKFELIPYTGEKGFYDRKSNYQGHILKKLTPRLLLQLLGTDCGRDIIHPNLWVNALMSEYTENENYVGGSGHTSYPTYSYSNWVVTDMRFPNEKKAIENKKGITIRVNRPFYYRYSEQEGFHVWSEDLEEKKKVYKINGTKTKEESYKLYTEDFYSNQHESETALDKSDFDYVIENNGSIEELIEKVREILVKVKII